jgi:hypothetical protein
MRGALVLAARFAVAGSMSYALGGVVGAVIGLIAIVLASAAVAVMLSAMPGHRDSHSPFTRIMLIICAIAGRQPGDYLPAASQEDQLAA